MWGKETLILEEFTSALLSFNLKKKASDENSQGKRLVVRSNQKCGRNKLGLNRETIKLGPDLEKGRTYSVISAKKQGM